MALAYADLAGTRKVELLDCTIRDGSYAVDFQFDEDFVAHLLASLNETPVSKVEIGHGVGLEAERSGVRACNIDYYRWSEIAASTLTSKPWGMFAQPEFTRLDTVAEMSDRGMAFIRVGMEPDKVGGNLDYLKRITDLCGQVYLNLMKTSSTPADELPAMLDEVSSVVSSVYIVDSYGGMLPADVRRYVGKVREQFPVVGFHGHDDLGLAAINTVAAMEAGATVADGTLNGVGRGSGNAAIESLAGIIKIIDDADPFGYEELARLAEYCRANLDVIPEDRAMQVLGAVIGIHSSYFPAVRELAAERGIDPARLMEAAVMTAEHSVRKEDLCDAAAELAGEASPAC